MIIFGTGGNTVELDVAEHMHCQRCQGNRTFGMKVLYRYFHLYFIFGVVTKKQFFLLCNYCQYGWECDAKEVQKNVSNIPIPLHHRFGLVGLFACFGGIMVITTILGQLGLMK